MNYSSNSNVLTVFSVLLLLISGGVCFFALQFLVLFALRSVYVVESWVCVIFSFRKGCEKKIYYILKH